LAIFVENGPYRINETTGEVTINPYSWNSNANVIFVDQPIGTGFSYGDLDDYVTKESQVAEDMYEFLQSFIVQFPQYAKLPFFVTGESYGLFIFSLRNILNLYILSVLTKRS
jgi:cathepsin A (carboxypeptidase C)